MLWAATRNCSSSSFVSRFFLQSSKAHRIKPMAVTVTRGPALSKVSEAGKQVSTTLVLIKNGNVWEGWKEPRNFLPYSSFPLTCMRFLCACNDSGSKQSSSLPTREACAGAHQQSSNLRGDITVIDVLMYSPLTWFPVHSNFEKGARFQIYGKRAKKRKGKLNAADRPLFTKINEFNEFTWPNR